MNEPVLTQVPDIEITLGVSVSEHAEDEYDLALAARHALAEALRALLPYAEAHANVALRGTAVSASHRLVLCMEIRRP